MAMSPVISLEELKVKLRAAPDATRRRLYFAALLARAAGIPTDDFIVVGGSAIEIYTVGEYTSGDIDIVSGRHERLRSVLSAWDFRKDGRVWVGNDLGFVVDLNRDPYTGDFQKTTIVTTPYGPVRLAAIEDLIVKRLVSAKYWKEPHDFDHAKLLAAGFADRIDWDYIERFASQKDVADFLARLREAVAQYAKGRKQS